MKGSNKVMNNEENQEATFMMRQTDYLEKRNGEWKIIHEHTSMADGWNGKIEE